MSLKQYIPAIKYGNSLATDEIDNAAIGNSALNPQIAQTAQVTVTSAQLLALGVTPVQLITTTTPGTAIIVESILFNMVPTSTTYTVGGASNLIFAYNNTTTSGSIMSGVIAQSVITSSSAGYVVLEASTPAAGITVLPNTGITMGLSGNNAVTVGTGTAKVTLNYYVVTI